MIEVVENLLMQLGRYGRWQILTFTLICAGANFAGAWNTFVLIFAGMRVTNSTCKLPDNAPITDSTVPKEENIDGDLVYSACKMFKYDSVPNVGIVFNPNKTMDCDNGFQIWEKEFKTSIQTEFDLFCDDEIQIDLTFTFAIIGALAGSVLLTPIGEMIGRKPYFLLSSWATAFVCLGQGFSPNLKVFHALSFFRGFFFQGIFSSGLVLACELWPADQRVSAGVFVQVFYAMGNMILAGMAVLTKKWDLLLFCISGPVVLSIPLIWLMPESIQWLIAKGRFEKVREIFEWAGKINKVPVNFRHFEEAIAKLKEQGGGEVDQVLQTQYRSPFAILYAPKIRVYTFVQFYLWVATNLGYFGLAFGTSSLGGDAYLNFFINAAVELPAVFICLFLLPKFGRRYVISAFFIIGGVGLLIMSLIQLGDFEQKSTVTTVFAMIGKLGIGGVFLNMMFYSSELTPTTHRNLGVAFCFVLGLLAGLVAPYIGIATEDHPWLAGTIFAIMALLAAGLVLLLPDTVNRPLPEVIEDVQAWTLRVQKEEKSDFQSKMKERRNSSKQDILEGINVNELKKLDLKYLNRRRSSGINLSDVKPELEPSTNNALGGATVLPAITKPMTKTSSSASLEGKGNKNGGFFLGEQTEKEQRNGDSTQL